MNIVSFVKRLVAIFFRNKKGLCFDEAVKLLHFGKIKKARMIGKDVVIYLVKRNDRGANLVVEDSAGNSMDVTLLELIHARWKTKDENRD